MPRASPATSKRKHRRQRSSQCAPKPSEKASETPAAAHRPIPDDPQVLVINLPRRPDRLLSMQAFGWGLPLHIIAAVDGLELSWDAAPVTGFVTKRAIKRAVDAVENLVPTVDDASHSFSPHLTLGAVACALSHRQAWTRIVERSRWAIIVEDDLYAVDHAFAERVVSAVEALPSNWGLMYLGHHMPNACLGTPDRCFAPVPRAERHGLVTGLFAYAVSPRGARILLRKTKALHEQVDAQVAAIDWSACKSACFVPSAPRGDVPCLALAEESGDSDVQTYAKEGGFLTHAVAPERFEDDFR